LFVNTSLPGWFLWACLSKKGEFRHFIVMIGLVGFSRISRVNRVSMVRLSIRFIASLVLVSGWDRTSRCGVNGVICRVSDVYTQPACGKY